MTPLLQERAPIGHLYSLATEARIQKGTRFVHSIERRPGRHTPGDSLPPVYLFVNFSPVAALAKGWNRLSIARAYCDMLNRTEHLAEDFCVVVRPR